MAVIGLAEGHSLADRNMEKIKKMKIFKIDVSKKKDGFDNLYSILDEKSKYALYPSTFVAFGEDDLIEALKGEKNIEISEVRDIESEISQEYIKNWLREEYIKLLHKEAEIDVQERTVAMYEILKDVEKHFSEKEFSDEENVKHEEPEAKNRDSSE